MTDWTLQTLQEALDDPPYQRLLGLKAVALDAEAGTVTLALPFKRELCRCSTEPEIHGGVTAALIDIAGDYALAIGLGDGVPTIDLRVDYLRMAVETGLTAKAKAVKRGRTLGVVDVEVTDDRDRVIAIGRATYYVKA